VGCAGWGSPFRELEGSFAKKKKPVIFLIFIALFVVLCLVFLKFGGLEVLLTFCKEGREPPVHFHYRAGFIKEGGTREGFGW